MRDEPTARMSPGRMVVVRSPERHAEAALPTRQGPARDRDRRPASAQEQKGVGRRSRSGVACSNAEHPDVRRGEAPSCDLPDAAADVRMEDARPMTFGGWMGRVRYADVPPSLLPLLQVAEGLHVGKHTAFGFGAIMLRDTGVALTGA